MPKLTETLQNVSSFHLWSWTCHSFYILFTFSYYFSPKKLDFLSVSLVILFLGFITFYFRYLVADIFNLPLEPWDLLITFNNEQTWKLYCVSCPLIFLYHYLNITFIIYLKY